MSAATILTASGRYLDLLDPEAFAFDIAEIARALSRICRFGGHTKAYYSVAQHCVHLSYRVPREDALAGLLHDAAEAFVGDVTAPLKALLPEYRAIEQRILGAILHQAGIAALPPSVRQADLEMLAIERRALMRPTDEPWPCLEGINPEVIILPRLGPPRAERWFLDRYSELAGVARQEAVWP